LRNRKKATTDAADDCDRCNRQRQRRISPEDWISASPDTINYAFLTENASAPRFMASWLISITRVNLYSYRHRVFFLAAHDPLFTFTHTQTARDRTRRQLIVGDLLWFPRVNSFLLRFSRRAGKCARVCSGGTGFFHPLPHMHL
jgi:hypothetical protein